MAKKKMTFDDWCLDCMDKGYAVVKIDKPSAFHVTKQYVDDRPITTFHSLLYFLFGIYCVTALFFTIAYLSI